MCGIIGRVGSDNVVPYLLNGLECLEYRGYDSAGIAVHTENGISFCKTVGRLAGLREKTENEKTSGFVGIGHTRWATHGGPTETNAHPHFSHDRKFALVHNGIIENSNELAETELAGVSFNSETDTEKVVHLLTKYYNGNVVETISKVISLLKGSYALGILCTDYPNTIFSTAMASPMVVAQTQDGGFICSDAGAISAYSKEYYPVKNGEICVLNDSSISFFSPDGQPMEKQAVKIDVDELTTDKQGYEHYMMLEMLQQPTAIKKTIMPLIKDNKINLENVDITDDYIQNTLREVVIVACGSAYHAGVVGKQLIESMCKIRASAEIASEFRYVDPLIDEHTLAVFISQSGETADTLAALRLAKQKGAKILSIVNVSGSAIANESDNVIFTRAGREVAVATTKAYSAQLAVLYALTLRLAKGKNMLAEDVEKKMIHELASLPQKIQQTIDKNIEKAELYANKFAEATDIYYIGRRLDYAASLEASLKMKEISYIHSEAYAAGELKHGTLSLVDPGVPVVALAGDAEIFGKTYSNICEVLARGAHMLVVTNESNAELVSEFEDTFIVPDTLPQFNVSLQIVPLQLLSYYTAKKKGCDIDKPKNLAKSVTVE
ncbi:MAG: glutamine--fructose-6-phosphate transaminase (isomerizing) [Ruminococcaceae bacterium]|nr:glutamine--fructose-6-phosphate transaminase (isomerizing) [Oscillospiraceae bacterium]